MEDSIEQVVWENTKQDVIQKNWNNFLYSIWSDCNKDSKKYQYNLWNTHKLVKTEHHTVEKWIGHQEIIRKSKTTYN